LTSSLLDAPPVVLPRGSETPRVWTYPPAVTSSGDDIADFCGENGLVLDSWQRLALRSAMGERSDGRWAAGEVGIVVPRQNGKGSILEAREIGGLFLLEERSIVHTAQQFRTAADAFKRVRQVIDGAPDLSRRVKRVLNSPVDKSIELHDGRKLSFICRGPNAGRGLSGTDLLIFDEAYDLTDAEMEALAPTMTTAPNPQVWYTSSAGKEHSVVLAGIRKRGVAGSPTLAYMEWSVPQPEVGAPPPDASDLEPGLGTRVSADYLAIERGVFSQNRAGLARERLGVFDPVPVLGGVFPEGTWEGCADRASTIDGPPVFAAAIAEDRRTAAVGASGALAPKVPWAREDGVIHVENVQNGPGTDWIVPYLAEVTARNGGSVVIDPGSPAGSLVDDLKQAGVRVHTVSARDYAQACGWIYDAVQNRDVRHLGQPELDVAVRDAQLRTLSGAFAWDLRKPLSDITPLVAVTLACWGHRTYGGNLADSVW